MKKILFLLFCLSIFNVGAATLDFNITSDAENTVAAGQDFSITYTYDVELLNELGAWITIDFDTQNAAWYSGTELESPYRFEIPGKAVKAGEHTITFYIHDYVNEKRTVIAAHTVVITAE